MPCSDALCGSYDMVVVGRSPRGPPVVLQMRGHGNSLERYGLKTNENREMRLMI